MSITTKHGIILFYFRHQDLSTAATRTPRRAVADRVVRLYSSDMARIVAFSLRFVISRADSNFGNFFSAAFCMYSWKRIGKTLTDCDWSRPDSGIRINGVITPS